MPAEGEEQKTRLLLREAASARNVGETVRLARELLAMGRTSDVQLCATAFKTISVELGQEGWRRLRTFVVRSVTVEPVLPFLHVEAVLAGYVLDVEVGGFGSYMDELLNPESALQRSQAAFILRLILWLRPVDRGQSDSTRRSPNRTLRLLSN